MTDFNDIGISRQSDWERIKKMLAIGFFAALLSFTGICCQAGALRMKR